MTDVLEKAIAELESVFQEMIETHPASKCGARLDSTCNSLRAEVERQKSAKPTDAAERLANKIEAEACGCDTVTCKHHDVGACAVAHIRVMGREHAAEIARWEAQSIAVNDAGLQLDKERADLRKSLDARVAELSEAHAAHDMTRAELAATEDLRAAAAHSWARESNRAIAAEAKANELAAERDVVVMLHKAAAAQRPADWDRAVTELQEERDAARAEAKRLRQSLAVSDANDARLRKSLEKAIDIVGHCCPAANPVKDWLTEAMAALSPLRPDTCVVCNSYPASAHHSQWASDYHQPVTLAELVAQAGDAALSDKGSGTDPASGSQGASSAPPGSQAAPEPARCPRCQHASHPGLRRCDECGFECAQRNGRIFPPPGYKAAVAKLQSTPTNPTTGWPEPTHAKCVGCGETRTICCADLAPIGEPMQNARCQACCPKHAPGMQRTWSTAELITFIRAESGRDALAAELAKTDAVVFALASKHRTRTPAHHPGFNGCKRCDCGWEPPRREWMDDSYVSRAEYEQDAKATTEVESQLAERIEALERHATAQVVIDKAAASHAANRVREVEGRVAAMKARLAAVSDAQDALNVQRLKHEGVTRELVGEVHDGDCPDLDEALRAAGWDK